MKIASLWNRVGGGLIDYIIVFTIGAVIMFLWGFASYLTGSSQYLSPELSNNVWRGRGLLVGLIVDCVYSVLMMASDRQATLGQQFAGVKIVNDDGTKISHGIAFGRWLVSLVSSVFLKLGFLIAIFSSTRKTLHDYAADTIVIDANENDREEVEEHSIQQRPKSKNIVATELDMSDEHIYEQVYEEFHSIHRKKGVYLKLLTNLDGNAEKAEFEYIRIRVKEIKLDEEQRLINEHKQGKDAAIQLELGKYETGNVAGLECLFFESGECAITVSTGKYRVYSDKKSLAKSALYFKDMGQYLTIGYLKTIDINKTDTSQKTTTLKCSKCEHKFKIKNITRMVECPNCERTWLFEQR